MFLNKFLEIGFEQSKPEVWSGAGWFREYTYYPNYLGDNHYTLVTFTHGEEDGHGNKVGKYVDSKFQLSYDKDWNDIFKLELRNEKLKELLND